MNNFKAARSSSTESSELLDLAGQRSRKNIQELYSNAVWSNMINHNYNRRNHLLKVFCARSEKTTKFGWEHAYCVTNLLWPLKLAKSIKEPPSRNCWAAIVSQEIDPVPKMTQFSCTLEPWGAEQNQRRGKAAAATAIVVLGCDQRIIMSGGIGAARSSGAVQYCDILWQ